MSVKGIILAGGSGTRLLPMTTVISKQLLPIFDKPMVYYPLSTLMLAGIKDILLISTHEDIGRYEKLFGDGSKWGINLNYAIQNSPDGIAQAFIIAEEFIGNDKCCLILGDNLFFGNELQSILKNAIESEIGATIFGYSVRDPQRYGVVEFNKEGKVISIEEKPLKPKSQFAITGLYFYDNNVIEITKTILPSDRGELEISSINAAYLDNNDLHVEIFGRGMTWLDTGTVESLMEAGEFVKAVQKRQGLVIACPEEISWRNGWITSEDLSSISSQYGVCAYKNYLISLLDEQR